MNKNIPLTFKRFLSLRRRICFLFLVCILGLVLNIYGSVTQALANDFDEPDLRYEKRLHNIYKDYHSSRTPVEQWEAMVGQRKKETYEIQKGDTLWGISQTFFGDGEYWPKIWSVNGKITNPHLISKGNSIVFLMGNEAEAPAFTVTDTATLTDNGFTQPESLREDEIPQEARNIIPPAPLTAPVLDKIPPSLPTWALVKDSDQDGAIYVEKIKSTRGDQRRLVTSYIVGRETKTVGLIAEMEAGVSFAAQGQYVYIKSDRNLNVSNREKLLVLKNRGLVEEATLTRYKKIKSHGYHLEVEGRVEVVERVKSKTGEDYYKALVLDAFSPISLGARLVRKRLKRVNVDLNGPRSAVKAKIVGGSLGNRRKFYTTRSIAFLDKGSNAGVSAGDILPIHEDRRLRKYNKTSIYSSPQPIGWLKVVDADEDYATAVVVKAWKEIVTGDRTGGEF